MDDTVNVGMFLEHLIQGAIIGDIELVELGALAANQFNPVDALFRGIVKIIGDDDFVAGFQESQGGEGSNVTSAAAAKYVKQSREVWKECTGIGETTGKADPATSTEPSAIFDFALDDSVGVVFGEL